MCGIVGFNYKDKDLITRLNDNLIHRGPDQGSFYCDDKVSLSHRRLSILDLSDRGIQPMHNEDRTIWLTFNGEIFNYKEIKQDLLNKGHLFNSNTDAEVLVHLYEEEGFEMLGRLNGQFSFCIYDKFKEKFFLARDRVGILPLFYYNHAGRFIFSSELKAILKAGINKEICEDALIFYLRFGFISSPDCILKNTHKLEPAHFLVYDLKKRHIELYERYWDIVFDPKLDNIQKISKDLRESLDKSVKMRLLADVPVGAFLSGGVDSSAIVALIKKHKSDLKTFSIKFDYADFDESKYAKIVSRFLGTDHHEIEFCSKDVRETINKLINHYDEPFGDSSAVPTYLVSKIARTHVAVSLSGDGADEILAGYERYKAFFLLRILNHSPSVIKFFIRLLLDLIILICPKFEFVRIRDVLTFDRLSDIELYEKLVEKINRRDLEELLMRKIDFSDTTKNIKSKRDLASLQHHDIVHYLEGDILTKVDRAAMANSLETRPPFLDHNFMELCFKIKPGLKIRGLKGKWILREAFKDLLPRVTLRRKKKGFGVPIKYYLKNELYDLVKKYVLEYKGHNYFNRDFLKIMQEKRNLNDTTRLYWNILMFNMWHEKWMGKNSLKV